MSSTLEGNLPDIVYAVIIGVFMVFQPRGLYYRWLKFKLLIGFSYIPIK